jgi:DNA-binding response OmpR family regulator
MSNLTISIFGSKIFLEIINEVKLFSKFNIKYYEDLDLCVKDAEKQNLLVVFFMNKNEKSFFNNKTYNFPSILIVESSTEKNKFSNGLKEQLNMPFTILEFEKKVISLIAKNEFKYNSLIQLENYTIDKNERKIKKNNIELQLSEKEINFLILFSKNKEPLSKNLVLKNVWKYSSESETHTVETHIHRLRKKIFEKFGDNNFIKNNNKGYYI